MIGAVVLQVNQTPTCCPPLPAGEGIHTAMMGGKAAAEVLLACREVRAVVQTADAGSWGLLMQDASYPAACGRCRCGCAVTAELTPCRVAKTDVVPKLCTLQCRRATSASGPPGCTSSAGWSCLDTTSSWWVAPSHPRCSPRAWPVAHSCSRTAALRVGAAPCPGLRPQQSCCTAAALCPPLSPCPQCQKVA